jgi:hypothetical protein
MSRADELNAAISRCQERAAYARGEFERFLAGKPDLTTLEGARSYRKLKNDAVRAENDLEVLERMLDRESGVGVKMADRPMDRDT